MSSLAVAFHFMSSFGVTIAALGGLLVSLGHSQIRSLGRVTRAVFSAGWLALALGAMLHGVAVIDGVPAPLAVYLRSSGCVLLLLALLVALKEKTPGLGRLGAALTLFAAGELALNLFRGLEAGEPLWVFARSLPLLASIVLFAWMWSIIRASVQARFMALFSVLLLAVVLAISGAMTNLFASNMATESLRRAGQEAHAQKRILESQIEESVSRARQVAELDSVRVAVARRDPLLASSAERLQAPGGPFDTSDFMAFIDPSGAILALSASGPDDRKNLEPEDAVALTGTKVVQSALGQVQAGSVDSLGSRKIALVGAFPIFNPPGFDPPGAPRGLAGAVALGRVIDEAYLVRVAARPEDEAFLLSRDRVLIGTSSASRGVLPDLEQTRRAIFDQGDIVTVRGDIGDDEYFTSYVPLEQPDGTVVGALALAEQSTILAETQADATRTVFLVALLAMAAAAVLSYVSASKITRPIIQLTEAAEKVRAGDLSVRVKSSGTDEVGVLAETFDQMAESVGTLTDELREAVHTEAGLRDRFETILHSMTDGVVAVDGDGAVVAFNQEAERILGMDAGKASGADVKKILQLSDASGNPLHLPIYELRSGSVRGFIGANKAPAPTTNGHGQRSGASSGESNGTGAPRAVEVTSAPITSDSAGVIGGVAVLRDLTGEMQVEKMKTAFLSNVSHELRTPLTPIKGYADLLKRKEVAREKAVIFLDGISQSAERLERIIDMLIDFSAMEAGRLSPRRSPVDLNRVTDELIERWKQEAASHVFEKKGFRRLPLVDVDPKLVPLAIVELIDNAVKFSPSGGKVVLSAEVGGTEDGRGELRISVADNGIGIGEEELSAISQSFAQVDQSATRAYGGLGLGLAYIQRIVEAHNGRLEVKSAPKKGSRFTMVLAVTLPPSQSRAKGRKPASR